jgi:2-amino-4-hydroxy-6-hydroxymethyldihydropteridine diphosphokinase
LWAAQERLAQLPDLRVLRFSSIYTSEPAYVLEQPSFANAVLLADTSLAPLELLQQLQAVEQEFGRDRSSQAQHWGPRTLDLDIIDYAGVVSDAPKLTLPHPLALERDFVVTPLLEVAAGHILANGAPVTRDKVTCGWVQMHQACEPNGQALPYPKGGQ